MPPTPGSGVLWGTLYPSDGPGGHGDTGDPWGASVCSPIPELTNSLRVNVQMGDSGERARASLTRGNCAPPGPGSYVYICPGILAMLPPTYMGPYVSNPSALRLCSPLPVQATPTVQGMLLSVVPYPGWLMFIPTPPPRHKSTEEHIIWQPAGGPPLPALVQLRTPQGRRPVERLERSRKKVSLAFFCTWPRIQRL